MQPHEAAGGHERKGEEQDACIPAPVGGLARRVAENKRDSTDDPEDHEVEPVGLDVLVELLSKQQRDEPHQRQSGGDQAHDEERARARAPSKRCSPTRIHATHFAQHALIGFPADSAKSAWEADFAVSVK
jgi:hypothetical protein